MTIGVVVIALVLATGSRGGLAYFSPSTLQYTTQTEFTLFFGALPIYRSSPHMREHPLITMLREARFVAPVSSDKRGREMVFHWNHAWRDGNGPLYDIFVRHRKQIIEWSKADRARAKIYWEEGFRHLRSPDEVEVWIGREILNRGWKCETIAELKRRIASIKESTYFEWRDRF